MSKKRPKIQALIEKFIGREHDPRYLAYFDCFNQGLYYEAHDVLEDLWLLDRSGQNGSFYKGLIQLAGGFVHLQKNRLRPAAALFKLAKTNFEKYPAQQCGLDMAKAHEVLDTWIRHLEQGHFEANPLALHLAPHLAPGPPCNNPAA